jgi:hypothetical protein
VGAAFGGFGIAPVVAGHRSHTFGTQASHLARAVAPPPTPFPPSRMPTGGEIFVLLFLGGIGAIILVGAFLAPGLVIGQRLTGVACALVWLTGPLTVLLLNVRHRRRLRVRYRAYVRVWPAAVRAWQDAMVCLRCHVAFFPTGAVTDVPAARGLVPLGQFGPAVLAVAVKLTDRAELTGHVGDPEAS